MRYSTWSRRLLALVLLCSRHTRQRGPMVANPFRRAMAGGAGHPPRPRAQWCVRRPSWSSRGQSSWARRRCRARKKASTASIRRFLQRVKMTDSIGAFSAISINRVTAPKPRTANPQISVSRGSPSTARLHETDARPSRDGSERSSGPARKHPAKIEPSHEFDMAPAGCGSGARPPDAVVT